MRGFRNSNKSIKTKANNKRAQEPHWQVMEEDIDTEQSLPVAEAMRMIARWLVRKHKRVVQQAGLSTSSDSFEH